jgi:ribosomal protein L12E/L44/L45/RPP1/RPP2
MRTTDPDIMDEHRVNTSRKRSPPNHTITTSKTTPKLDSSESVQVEEKPKPDVIDLSIEDIESMFQTDVLEQATIAAAAANADSDAEEEAKRTGKAVKRKKNNDSDKNKPHRDSPSPDKDKGKRLA